VEVVEPGYRKWSCFEKGGVNVSAVHGKLPEAMQKLFVGKPIFALISSASKIQRFMPTGAISKCMMRTEM
jgi:coproporphyrinogen III oxidase